MEKIYNVLLFPDGGWMAVRVYVLTFVFHFPLIFIKSEHSWYLGYTEINYFGAYANPGTISLMNKSISSPFIFKRINDLMPTCSERKKDLSLLEISFAYTQLLNFAWGSKLSHR